MKKKSRPKLPDLTESKLEHKFFERWKQLSPKQLTLQHQFHPSRQWRFDFAHLPSKLAIEVQGFGEGHTSYEGMLNDYEKHNEAVRLGWRIIYIMSKNIKPRILDSTIRYIEAIIDNKQPTNIPSTIPEILRRARDESTRPRNR